MSGSPKYTTVLSGAARRARLELERAVRERRRAAEREAAEAAAREAARIAAERERALAEAKRREAERARRIDEQIGLADLRYQGLVRDARESGVVATSVLTEAAEAIARVRALRAQGDEEAAREAPRLAGILDRADGELDAEIDRVTSRRELVGLIAEALPGLGFMVDPGSLIAGGDGSLGIQATRHTGEIVAVVVANDGEGDRVSYLADPTRTGPDGITLDAPACTFLAQLAETVNEPVRAAGFEAGPVRWDDADGTPQALPPGGGAVRRESGGDAGRRAGR